MPASYHQAAPSVLYVIVYFVCRCNGVLVRVEGRGQRRVPATLFSETWGLTGLESILLATLAG